LKSTGTKLDNLEQQAAVKSFLNSLLADKVEAWTQEEELGFSEIYHELIHKINDCVSPLSNALYSSIMVYKKESEFLIHAGANIDPETTEQLKDPIFRNCAEKQAAVSALTCDKETNKALKILFLFRKAHQCEIFPAEKLIPCKDCYKAYIEDLIANSGKLVLVIEDDEPREFLLPGYKAAESVNEIRTFKTTMGEAIHYVIFDSEAMKFLKVEKELGMRVCG